MVVVDRFSKYGVFIPLPKTFHAQDAAKAFFKEVIKNWGIPKSIISDRDPRFTGRFWMELFKMLGSELNFSTSFHPHSAAPIYKAASLSRLYRVVEIQCLTKLIGQKGELDWNARMNLKKVCFRSQYCYFVDFQYA